MPVAIPLIMSATSGSPEASFTFIVAFLRIVIVSFACVEEDERRTPRRVLGTTTFMMIEV
jgi:hypothetical protein